MPNPYHSALSSFPFGGHGTGRGPLDAMELRRVRHALCHGYAGAELLGAVAPRTASALLHARPVDALSALSGLPAARAAVALACARGPQELNRIAKAAGDPGEIGDNVHSWRDAAVAMFADMTDEDSLSKTEGYPPYHLVDDAVTKLKNARLPPPPCGGPMRDVHRPFSFLYPVDYDVPLVNRFEGEVVALTCGVSELPLKIDNIYNLKAGGHGCDNRNSYEAKCSANVASSELVDQRDFVTCLDESTPPKINVVTSNELYNPIAIISRIPGTCAQSNQNGSGDYGTAISSVETDPVISASGTNSPGSSRNLHLASPGETARDRLVVTHFPSSSETALPLGASVPDASKQNTEESRKSSADACIAKIRAGKDLKNYETGGAHSDDDSITSGPEPDQNGSELHSIAMKRTLQNLLDDSVADCETDACISVVIENATDNSAKIVNSSEYIGCFDSSNTSLPHERSSSGQTDNDQSRQSLKLRVRGHTTKRAFPDETETAAKEDTVTVTAVNGDEAMARKNEACEDNRTENLFDYPVSQTDLIRGDDKTAIESSTSMKEKNVGTDVSHDADDGDLVKSAGPGGSRLCQSKCDVAENAQVSYSKTQFGSREARANDISDGSTETRGANSVLSPISDSLRPEFANAVGADVSENCSGNLKDSGNIRSAKEAPWFVVQGLASLEEEVCIKKGDTVPKSLARLAHEERSKILSLEISTLEAEEHHLDHDQNEASLSPPTNAKNKMRKIDSARLATRNMHDEESVASPSLRKPRTCTSRYLSFPASAQRASLVVKRGRVPNHSAHGSVKKRPRVSNLDADIAGTGNTAEESRNSDDITSSQSKSRSCRRRVAAASENSNSNDAKSSKQVLKKSTRSGSGPRSKVAVNVGPLGQEQRTRKKVLGPGVPFARPGRSTEVTPNRVDAISGDENAIDLEKLSSVDEDFVGPCVPLLNKNYDVGLKRDRIKSTTDVNSNCLLPKLRRRKLSSESSSRSEGTASSGSSDDVHLNGGFFYNDRKISRNVADSGISKQSNADVTEHFSLDLKGRLDMDVVLDPVVYPRSRKTDCLDNCGSYRESSPSLPSDDSDVDTAMDDRAKFANGLGLSELTGYGSSCKARSIFASNSENVGEFNSESSSDVAPTSDDGGSSSCTTKQAQRKRTTSSARKKKGRTSQQARRGLPVASRKNLSKNMKGSQVSQVKQSAVGDDFSNCDRKLDDRSAGGAGSNAGTAMSFARERMALIEKICGQINQEHLNKQSYDLIVSWTINPANVLSNDQDREVELAAYARPCAECARDSSGGVALCEESVIVRLTTDGWRRVRRLLHRSSRAASAAPTGS